MADTENTLRPLLPATSAELHLALWAARGCSWAAGATQASYMKARQDASSWRREHCRAGNKAGQATVWVADA